TRPKSRCSINTSDKNGVLKYRGFVMGKRPTWVWPPQENGPVACSGDSGGAIFEVISYPNAYGVGNTSLGVA
ncbi:MAG: hypothetical protein KDD92_16790, partial [Caldilineaceae bacterium]|nr:hypothetical protein [Caldilineaceae bacterium]